MTTERDTMLTAARALQDAIILLKEALALLEEASETLDNYSDVNDGDDGRPQANSAMATKARIDEFLGE